MHLAGLVEGQTIRLIGDAGDARHREVSGMTVVEYDVPPSCIAAYYPACNPLIALDHHAEQSHVPAAKSVPVRIEA